MVMENPMIIDDLTEIYRVEKKSGSLMNVRSDLYKAMADLLKRQREEYDAELSKDPDSIMCEGANNSRKTGLQTSGSIVEMRMLKILKMALRGAMGASNSLDALTPEEKEYYEAVLKLSTSHKNLINRLSGKISYTTKTLVEEPPAVVPVPPVAEEFPPEEEYYEPEDEVIPIPVEETTPVAEETKVAVETAPEVIEAGAVDLEEEPEPVLPDDELDKMMPIETAIPTEEISPSDLVVVRILQDVPIPISGYHNLVYNLKKENVVRLPTVFANVLINGGIAKKISVSP